MKVKITILFILFLVCFAPLGADPVEPSPFESLAALAVENNLELRESLWDLEKSRSDLPGLWDLDAASLFLEGEIRQVQEDYTPSVAASLTVPVVDQLRFSGTVRDDRSGQAGISLFPLAHSDDTVQGRLNLTILEARVAETKIAVENGAITAALDLAIAREALAIQEALTDLREQEYRDARVRYEAGEEVLDEVRRTLQVWSEARSLRVSRQDQVQVAETALVQALGREDVALPAFTAPNLEAEILKLQTTLTLRDASAGATAVIREGLLSRESLASTLKNTWAFSPTLQADLGISWDDRGNTILGGSVSLSFSLEDFQGDQREELRGDLALLEARNNQALVEEKQKLDQALSALDMTRLNREVAKLALDEAAGLAEEAELLYSLGEYSALEREAALLDHRTAGLSYIQALTDQYTAWLNLRIYLY